MKRRLIRPFSFTASFKLQIRLFHTIEHACGYFDDRTARNLITDPQLERTAMAYNGLIEQGFRRSGEQIFRPDCRGCQACIATRIDVARFTPSRSQRRCQKRNADLTTRLSRARYTDRHFALYRDYLDARHPGAGMDNPSRDDYERFLYTHWSNTMFVEAWDGDELLSVAVTDVLRRGLSAVYTFFRSDLPERGLGTLSILNQIELARSNNLPYVYLGYWIKNHPKMHYKSGYAALEIYEEGIWLNKNDLSAP